MKKYLFWPFQIYVWLILIPLAVVLTILFSTLTIIFSYLVSPHFASRVFAVTWAKCLAWLTPMLVEVQGEEHAQKDRSYVVVCNHQSMYDILVLYGWLRLDMKWVMKAELRKVPFIGIGCEKAGHIFVNRRSHKQAAEAINAALERLGDGIGILFFPEGTRSNDGQLLPFKKGAFHTAIEQQIPLLPVTVAGTREIVPNKTLKVFPGRAKMVIHPAIETAGLSHDDLRDVMERARVAIGSALPPGGD